MPRADQNFSRGTTSGLYEMDESPLRARRATRYKPWVGFENSEVWAKA